MKWIKISESQPSNWNETIVKILPFDKTFKTPKLIYGNEVTLPIRKNAKNIPIKSIDYGDIIVPVECLEWLNITSGDAILFEQINEDDKIKILTIFHKIKHLATHTNDDNKIKEIFHSFEQFGFSIHKK